MILLKIKEGIIINNLDGSCGLSHLCNNCIFDESLCKYDMMISTRGFTRKKSTK